MSEDIYLDETTIEALSEVMPVIPARRSAYPYAFACPSGVLRERGLHSGCTEIMAPYADAVAEISSAGAVL